ncbi:cupin domain-containing protein [Streptomyces sp. NPDC091267]|uniref:cupin domain-containing protein n=1 Tax=Streptomyces sp. NPDC091267 TaxID=3155195 RepID=UPI003414CF36
MALDRCIPLTTDDFMSRVFGQRHLHTPAARLPDGFGDLFSPGALDEVLSSGLRTSSIRLLRDNVEAPVTRATVPEPGDAPGSAPFVSPDAVRAALDSGHTLIVRSLQRFHPPLRRFAQALTSELGHPVRVNAFITPPRSQGVDLHYDIEDVLVLQIAGSKRWVLRTQPMSDPLPAHAWFNATDRRRDELRSASRPLDDLVLREGDSLYFPRGTLHSPCTQDELSIHLTVAVTPVTHHDLLTELVRRAADDSWLRATVGLDALDNDPELTRNVLAEVARSVAEAAATCDPADLLWAVRRTAFREHLPEPVPVLPGPAHAHRLRAGAQFRLTGQPGDDKVLLTVGGRSALLPAATEPFLRALRDTPVVDRAGLAAALGAEGAGKVADALVTIGLLVPVSDAGASAPHFEGARA